MDTTKDVVGCRGQFAHLTPLRGPFHLQELGPYRIIPARRFDLRRNPDLCHRFGEGNVDLGACWHQIKYQVLGILRALGKQHLNPTPFQRLGYALQRSRLAGWANAGLGSPTAGTITFIP